MEIKTKSHGMLTMGVCLPYNNLTANSAHKIVNLTGDMGEEILPQLLYPPKLTPSDFFLSHNMKKPTRGRSLNDENKVTEVDLFLKGLEVSTRTSIFLKKCVTLGRRYVEKV